MFLFSADNQILCNNAKKRW